jgi:ornithine cyclodeaminase/alanine dehydrogenase-like protein (mu-crystallin family)
VRQLVSVDDAARIIEGLFRDEAQGLTEQRPTIEIRPPKGMFRVKVGGAYGSGAYGLKAYLGNAGYRVFVYGTETGFEGLVEAYDLTEIRTGAVSAVATKYMARENAATLGILGTGREARAQLRAVSRVRNLRRVKAWSRSPDNRAAYAREMSAELGVEVVPVDDAETCVRGSDIVLTITSANEPILDGVWLSPGTFVCGVGATGPQRRELDDEAVGRAAVVVVEHLRTAQDECGELIHAAESGRLRWDGVTELKDVVSGARPGRRNDNEITLFTSVGTGAEDVAMAAFVLQQAKAQGVGLELPIPPPKSRAR